MSEHHNEHAPHSAHQGEHSHGLVKRARVEGDVRMGKTLRLRGGSLVTAGRRLLGVAVLAGTGLAAYEAGTPGKTIQGAYDKAQEFVFTKDYVARQLFDILLESNEGIKNGTAKGIGMKTLETAFEAAGITKSRFESEVEWQEVLKNVQEKYADYKAELLEKSKDKKEIAAETGSVPAAPEASAPVAVKEKKTPPKAAPVADVAPAPVPDIAPIVAPAPAKEESTEIVATTNYELGVKAELVRIKELYKQKHYGPAQKAFEDLEKKLKALPAGEKTPYIETKVLPFVRDAIKKCEQKINGG